MASKVAWLVGKRGILIAVAALAAVVGAKTGIVIKPYGFWDGPG